MQSQDNNNKVIIAVAGSGKTTFLVKEAISSPKKKILFLTYTNENLLNIKKVFEKQIGYIPPNVEVKTWFSFLLKDGARPYHNFVSNGPRIVSIHFVEGSSNANPALRFISESNTEKYYFDEQRRIYTDKLSQYVYKCNSASNGLVIKRLEEIYDAIYIDEVQDLAGWDLEVIKLFFASKTEILVVGDPRQVTYLTNHSNKNSGYRGEKIVTFFEELASQNLCKITNLTDCHRCNQEICNLADSVYPSLAKSISSNTSRTGHDGIFSVPTSELDEYIRVYNPVLLRHDARSKTHGRNALNFGMTKGSTFDRVLIFPTDKMKKFFETRDASEIPEATKAKLYVAITRARHSVTFLI